MKILPCVDGALLNSGRKLNVSMLRDVQLHLFCCWHSLCCMLRYGDHFQILIIFRRILSLLEIQRNPQKLIPVSTQKIHQVSVT